MIWKQRFVLFGEAISIQTRKICKSQTKPQHSILNPKISTPCDRQQGAISVCLSLLCTSRHSFLFICRTDLKLGQIAISNGFSLSVVT